MAGLKDTEPVETTVVGPGPRTVKTGPSTAQETKVRVKGQTCRRCNSKTFTFRLVTPGRRRGKRTSHCFTNSRTKDFNQTNTKSGIDPD